MVHCDNLAADGSVASSTSRPRSASEQGAGRAPGRTSARVEIASIPASVSQVARLCFRSPIGDPMNDPYMVKTEALLRAGKARLDVLSQVMRAAAPEFSLLARR